MQVGHSPFVQNEDIDSMVVKFDSLAYSLLHETGSVTAR